MGQFLTHYVSKEFEDGDVRRLVGECVNALPWRTRQQLENLRYIQTLPEGLEPIADDEGRYWMADEWLVRHGRTAMPVEVEQQQSKSEKPEPKKKGGRKKAGARA